MDPRLVAFFEEAIPFNKWLGMRIVDGGPRIVRVSIPFRPELVGDPLRPSIHGGVISTLADTAGGLAVFAAIGSTDARISTVDLRIDYYAPGQMRDLFADAEVVRLGNRVAVARVSIHHGDPSTPIAEGKAVYNQHLRRK